MVQICIYTSYKLLENLKRIRWIIKKLERILWSGDRQFWNINDRMFLSWRLCQAKDVNKNNMDLSCQCYQPIDIKFITCSSRFKKILSYLGDGVSALYCQKEGRRQWHMVVWLWTHYCIVVNGSFSILMFCPKQAKTAEITPWTHGVIITSLLRQNDVILT